jgi:dienelactone hydrolase
VSTLGEALNCSIGYFGASTGAASALKAAADLPQVNAVVSRGGRPDLAMDVLDKVKAPTLLIVGSLDYDVLELNEKAYRQLNCEKKLELVPGASHLFEEYGALDKVTAMAGSWFSKYLQPQHSPGLLKST